MPHSLMKILLLETKSPFLAFGGCPVSIGVAGRVCPCRVALAGGMMYRAAGGHDTGDYYRWTKFLKGIAVRGSTTALGRAWEREAWNRAENRIARARRERAGTAQQALLGS